MAAYSTLSLVGSGLLGATHCIFKEHHLQTPLNIPLPLLRTRLRGFDTNLWSMLRHVLLWQPQWFGIDLWKLFNDRWNHVHWSMVWRRRTCPQTLDDPWAESADISPFYVGSGSGKWDRTNRSQKAMLEAHKQTKTSMFIYRAENWYSTWFEEYMASDDSMWSVGCGWD